MVLIVRLALTIGRFLLGTNEITRAHGSTFIKPFLRLPEVTPVDHAASSAALLKAVALEVAVPILAVLLLIGKNADGDYKMNWAGLPVVLGLYSVLSFSTQMAIRPWLMEVSTRFWLAGGLYDEIKLNWEADSGR